LRVEDYRYHSRECASCILQPLWHSHETKYSEGSDKACLFFVFLTNYDLMIS
jgi:hypothetical protein